jgi:hypothetical protein
MTQLLKTVVGVVFIQYQLAIYVFKAYVVISDFSASTRFNLLEGICCGMAFQ